MSLYICGSKPPLYLHTLSDCGPTSCLDVWNLQVLAYDHGGLFAHHDGGRVGVLVRRLATRNMKHVNCVEGLRRLTEATLEGQIDISATLRFCTPYTLRRVSTTPPLWRGFMAQVPS